MGLCNAGEAGVRSLAEAVSRFFAEFIKRPALCCACLYDRDSACEKYGEHSALNMFTEYSMTDQDVFEEYTGFTENEVKELCECYQMDFVQTSGWYDGYTFTKYQHIYNPKSVVEAMRRHKFSNYWTSTEVYDALKIYMEMDFDGLRADIVQMLGGGRVRVNTRSFRNDMRNFA